MDKFLKRYKGINIAAKASIWFMLCNLMQKGISTITVPIFTRLLSTAEYGTYSLYLSWFNILTIVTSLNLYYGVFYNAMNKLKQSQERDRYIASMQGITITLTMFLVIVFLPFQDFWCNVLGLSKIVVWLMLLELLVEPALQFWSVRQRFEYKYKIMVGITLLKSMLNPILGLVLVSIEKDNKATARIVSVVMVEVIFAGTIMIIQFLKGKLFYDKSNWKSALTFNIPLIPHYLAGTILNQGDRIMIQQMVGKSEVGIYSVAYNIGMLVQLVTNAISNSMNPWIYDKLNHKEYETIRKRVNEILFCIAIIIVMIMFFVPEVVKLFATTEYYKAIYVVPPVAVSMFFIFLYTLFASPQLYFEEQKFMSLSSVIAAILNVILNWIFISVFGYVAAGYTTLICYVLYSAGHFLFSKKVCLNKIGEEIFDIKTISLISVLLCVIAILFTLMYKMTIIRYAIALILLCFIIVNRNKIFDLYKKVKNKN